MTPEDLVFIDESGVKVGMRRTHARSARGARAMAHERCGRGKNLTIIGALGIEGIVAADLLDGSMRTPDFVRFFKDELMPVMKRGQAAVLDNLRIHHTAELAPIAKAHGIYIIYLPPYSPDLNPIEKGWSKLKAWLRKRGAPRINSLVRAVRRGLARIVKKDVLGWMKHCGYPTPVVST